jgi:hypothetical protein
VRSAPASASCSDQHPFLGCTGRRRRSPPNFQTIPREPAPARCTRLWIRTQGRHLRRHDLGLQCRREPLRLGEAEPELGHRAGLPGTGLNRPCPRAMLVASGPMRRLWQPCAHSGSCPCLCNPVNRSGFLGPFGLGQAAKTDTSARAWWRASAWAGGTLPMSSSGRRLLNQPTHSRGELDGSGGSPRTPAAIHLGPEQAVDGPGESVATAAASAADGGLDARPGEPFGVADRDAPHTAARVTHLPAASQASRTKFA